MGRLKNFMLVLLFVAGSTVVFAQSEFLTPGENLVVEGIPGIPVAMVEEINRYTEFR